MRPSIDYFWLIISHNRPKVIKKVCFWLVMAYNWPKLGGSSSVASTREGIGVLRSYKTRAGRLGY